MINPQHMWRRVTLLVLCVCVCVCVCVCLSVRAIFGIPHNKTPKNGHHKNQRPMGKILCFVKCFVPKLQLFSIYTVPKVSHFVTSVSMHKGLHAFSDGSNMHLRSIGGVLNAT